jgi:uncharacterized protein YcfJ
MNNTEGIHTMEKMIYGCSVSALLMFSAPMMANTSYDYARVIESIPIYQEVRVATPRKDCWNEQVVTHRRGQSGSSTPVIISTIIGGALGNAVGHGKSNRRVGTVVGAVLGHSVGRDIVRHNSGPSVETYETVQRCEVVHDYEEQRRLVGYQVRYRFYGEDYTVRMDNDPGDRIQVKVRVEPLR